MFALFQVCEQEIIYLDNVWGMSELIVMFQFLKYKAMPLGYKYEVWNFCFVPHE